MYEKIVEMICAQFDMEPSEISEDTSFVEDMGIDSLDVVELVMEIETEFNMPDTQWRDLQTLLTVRDLADYVSAHAGI